MSDHSPLGGCSKHGPFEACCHTEATCPDTTREFLRKNLLEKRFQLGDECPKGNEWVEISKKPLQLVANELYEELRRRLMGEGFSTKVPLSKSQPEEAIPRAFQSIFKNGLKSSEEWNINEKPFGFRFVDTPVSILKDDGVIMAISYEVLVYLKPRYEKDGDSGYYDFVFTIKVKSLSDKYLNTVYVVGDENKQIHVTTVVDNNSRDKARVRAQKVLQESQLNWENSQRLGLLNTVSGGLPSLGKRK